MIKRKLIPSALLFILILAFLVVPVAADLTITDGEKITTTDGYSLSGITIMGPEITKNGTITIDVLDLNAYLASGNLTDSNVQVMSYTAAIWTAALANNTLTLTSTETSTVEYETVYLTFLGTAENPWISNTAGVQTIPLMVKRTDGLGVGTINFVIETNGLSVADGEKITAADGTTSPVITIANSPIVSGGSITVNISGLNDYIVGGTLTTGNVKVTSFPTEGIWAGIVSDNTLTLISNGDPVGVGETVTVTFSGPWIPDTGGKKIVSLTANRSDGLGKVTFNFRIETPAPGGLSVINGEKIITRTGSTTLVFKITNAPIAENGTIVIDILNLNSYVANGTFTNANIVVDDTAANATWTGTVTMDEYYGTYLTLKSTGVNTSIGETVIVTFTGAAGSAWLADTMGTEWSGTYTATRTDTNETCDFSIVMETSLGPGGLVVTDGAMVNATDGSTSIVFTITEAPVLQYDTILISVADLNGIVANGTFTDANVIVDDTAANATWTGVVENDGLTLKSNGGETAVNETVTVTFTGPWIPNTNGNRTIILTAYRMDNYGAYDYRSYDFNFVIETLPPAGYALDVDFSATPRSDLAPLSVSFTDLSKGSPTEWSWDFGDGGTSTNQNPGHIYTQPGLYSVSLTVWNEYSMGLVSKTNYINVLNGAIVETDTEFGGLTIANCGGPQTITVNTTILPAELSPGKSVLEIQAPLGSGFKNITFYALNGIGFTQNGDIINGDPTRVILVSEEIAPPSGFSDSIGKMSSFTYSIDLPSYPCNAILSTKIWEGIIPEYDAKLQNITSGNTPPAVSIGTAYTAKITKTNFPPGAKAKIYMSVNSGWNPSLSGGPGTVFIWWIAEDGNSGQILPTNFLNTDPVTNLAYYEADSPMGFSTFGISSLTGSNNPFQMVAFVAAQVINEGGNIQSSAGGGSGTSVSTNAEPGSPYSEMMQGGGIVVPTPIVTAKAPALSQPAMSTNVGMIGWLFAIIQENPLVLVVVVGIIAVAAYFGWYKKRL